MDININKPMNQAMVYNFQLNQITIIETMTKRRYEKLLRLSRPTLEIPTEITDGVKQSTPFEVSITNVIAPALILNALTGAL